MPDNVHYITKKKNIEDVKKYLRNAKTKDFAPAAWARGNERCFGHGEGRSTSKETYHIGFKMQSDRHHITCSFIDKDWGVEPPSPAEALLFYKKAWGVEDSDDEDDKE
ncbi:hypothetical protein Focb16_v008168 [Fusarium oxysporum f. sp. cubense]|uniref:Uncharacterized protein n=1 Tax=Fusarium oxysporum f. sp. cubense TaxID=61366 RepID=A0A559LW67_FUSOC|nr:hypothetical protein Focb16_v008168 [Fusarium oxysporum f. sp. cubense]